MPPRVERRIRVWAHQNKPTTGQGSERGPRTFRDRLADVAVGALGKLERRRERDGTFPPPSKHAAAIAAREDRRELVAQQQAIECAAPQQSAHVAVRHAEPEVQVSQEEDGWLLRGERRTSPYPSPAPNGHLPYTCPPASVAPDLAETNRGTATATGSSGGCLPHG